MIDAEQALKLLYAGNFPAALAAYDELTVREPKRQALWHNRGIALFNLHHWDRAASSFTRALSIGPAVSSYLSRAHVNNWKGLFKEALSDYDAVLKLDPGNITALSGRSVTLGAMLRFDEALACADETLRAHPDNPGARFIRAQHLLCLGNFAEGLREHEYRDCLDKTKLSQPLWDGQWTKKRILVRCEQGFGDMIQFSRYLEFCRGLDIVVAAPPQLVRLFRHQYSFPVVVVGERLPEFDVHCNLMSLPCLFGERLETIMRGPYISVPSSNRLDRHPRPRIGIVWSSGKNWGTHIITGAMHLRKSIMTEEFRAIVETPGATFISLQKDSPLDDGTLGITDAIAGCEDFYDTAALLNELDLVITIDSAVAHLAAAMGKPTWVLVRNDVCWRWLAGGIESPWYATAKLFRQHRPLDWRRCLKQVKSELKRFIEIARH